MVIQDMQRVFIVRIGCQKAETCSVLLQPILSWISERVSDSSSPSEMDGFKVIIFFNCNIFTVISNFAQLNVFLLLFSGLQIS